MSLFIFIADCNKKENLISTNSGYLSPKIRRCTIMWLLHAGTGQRWKFTLIDYSTGLSHHNCAFMTITDIESKENLTNVCRANEPSLSKGHKVKVTFRYSPKTSNFLLHYEGKK